jgi:hypothetical protein
MAGFGVRAGSGDMRFAFLGENLLQQWVPADPAQEWLWDRRQTGRRRWLLGDEQQATAAGFSIPDGWPTGRWRAPYGDFYATAGGRQPRPRAGHWAIPTPAFLAALPRDPRELYDRMRADSPARDRPGSIGVLARALEVLNTGLVPADLRAALYQVLLLRGARITPPSEMELALTLTLDDGEQRTDLLVEPANGQFVGSRRTVTGDRMGLPAGTVTQDVRLTIAVVDTIGILPAD